jgi:hypothetical protein
MSSRWPQDQRSPYATYEDSWPAQNDGPQSWPEPGWPEGDQQAADSWGGGQWGDQQGGDQWGGEQGGGGQGGGGQQGYGDQWVPAQGPAQSWPPVTAQAVPEAWAPERDYPDQPYVAPDSWPAAQVPQVPQGRLPEQQQEWDQGSDGFGDDADYGWYDYLSQGRPAKTTPDRGGSRPERSRSGRRRDKPVPADPGYGRPERVDPGFDPAGFADPGIDPSGLTDPGIDPSGLTDPGFGQPGPVDQGYGPPGFADPGYQRPPSRRGDRAARSGDTGDPRGQAVAVTTRRARPRPVPRSQPGDDQLPGRQGRGRAAVKRQGRQAPARTLISAEAPEEAVPSRAARRAQARPVPERQAARQSARARGGRKPRKRFSGLMLALVAGTAVAGGAAFIVLTGSDSGGVPHTVTAPADLGAYVKEPQLAVQMQAKELQQEIVTQSAGEARNVIYAVYEDAAGTAAKSGPQIVLFIGGNLTGTSDGSFISSFTGKLQGAVTTSAGSLGGEAACVPSVSGRLAECAWADNDTFGVVASPTLNATALASEMRQIRPMVEHRSSKNS